MGEISKETRAESLFKTDGRTRQAEILGAWEGSMTAREIGRKLHYQDLNAVKPRITELVKAGKLVEAGKKYDVITDRNVTCWRKAE